MKRQRLTQAQENALRLAYADDFILYGVPDPDGVRRATLQSLKKQGWVRPDDPSDPEGTLVLSRRGRSVLGLRGTLMRKPKRFRTALVRAISHFVDDRVDLKSKDILFVPKDLPGAVWVDDERRADFSAARLLLDLEESDLDWVEDVDWSCVATLVTELGFPCFTSRTRYIQAFWPEEE